MKKPHIAILMATYNGDRFLREQIKSILFQSYQNFTLFISDDCSSDFTLKILTEFKKKYPDKIFFSVNDENLGVVKNFEKLLLNCDETYISLSDQDDIWIKNKLELQVKEILDLEYIHHNQPCLVHSDLEMIDEKNNVLNKSFFDFRKIFLNNEKSVNKIIGHNGVMGCTVLFNVKLKNYILPFPDELNVHDYWIAVINEVIGHRRVIKSKLVKYRIHDSNTSNTRKKILGHKRNKYEMFFNNDKLPFIGIKREVVLNKVLSKFEIEANDKKNILAFICYLENCQNPIFIIYKLIKYNLIREDFLYRLKIFIKLLQKKI